MEKEKASYFLPRHFVCRILMLAMTVFLSACGKAQESTAEQPSSLPESSSAAPKTTVFETDKVPATQPVTEAAPEVRLYTRDELNAMSDKELFDLFVSRGMQIDEELRDEMSEERLIETFKKFYVWLPVQPPAPYGLEAFRNFSDETYRVYPLLVGQEAADKELETWDGPMSDEPTTEADTYPEDHLYTKEELDSLSMRQLLNLFISRGMKVEVDPKDINRIAEIVDRIRSFYRAYPENVSSLAGDQVYREIVDELRRVYPLVTGEGK